MEIIKTLKYKEEDNIGKLVKCCKSDENILRNIPHQPGEFSDKPFKLTTTCNPNKQGDYYDYYTGSKQLATFENNIKTSFKHINIQSINNVKITRIKTSLSIHQQYKLEQLNDINNYDYDVCLCFIFKGSMIWGEFMQDWLPYLFFAKDILKKNSNIKIICKEVKFDSYNIILKELLEIDNSSIILKEYKSLNIKKLYYYDIKGPFTSGLFPYQGHCTCPITLYKSLYTYIEQKKPNILEKHNNNFKNIYSIDFNKKILVYLKRNTGNKTRNISNEIEIENLLKNYCNNNEFQYIGFYYNNYNFYERIKIFNNANIVVGVHGSCMFHNLFTNNKKVKVLELICIRDCHSSQLVNLSYGNEYWQIPIPEHGQFEKQITVSKNSLNSIKEILNNNIIQ